MNKFNQLLICAAAAVTLGSDTARAQLNIPSDGSDGALIVSNTTVIDLSQAVTGVWDASNTNNAGKGIYDSNKWAVVFKYSSVVISNGATVTFANHASRAPVVWLVNGDVTINGTLNLNGQSYVASPGHAEPGPGGFRGGSGTYDTLGPSAGFGPGGGRLTANDGGGGSFGSLGKVGTSTYGNPSLIPLIGGSGGAGDSVDAAGGAGAGGGGILIACSQRLSTSGTIQANGGFGATPNYGAGNGSGGAIRLVAETLSGNGVIQALGNTGRNPGGLGLIRIERVVNNNNLQVTPATSPVTLAAGSTPLIWLPADGPTARIVSIGAVNAPADPSASFGTFGADVTLPQVSTTPVIIETTIAESASIVTVRVSPRANGNYTSITATLTQTNSTSPLVLLWTANVPVNPGYSAVQVKVVRP